MQTIQEKPVFYFERIAKEKEARKLPYTPNEELLLDDTRIWSVDEYNLLDDDNRYEIIDGKLFMSPAPNTNHQRNSRDLQFSIYLLLKNTQIGEIFAAPYDVHFDRNNIVQPDLVVVGKDKSSQISARGFEGAPDIVVEILSPSTKPKDLKYKYEMYQKFKVPEYWIVDPYDKSVEIFVLDEKGAYQIFDYQSKAGIIKSWFLKGYELEISEIFNF
jgi:Uma2 family endonuclease